MLRVGFPGGRLTLYGNGRRWRQHLRGGRMSVDVHETTAHVLGTRIDSDSLLINTSGLMQVFFLFPNFVRPKGVAAKAGDECDPLAQLPMEAPHRREKRPSIQFGCSLCNSDYLGPCTVAVDSRGLAACEQPLNGPGVYPTVTVV